jgi:hypothetical protein
MTEFIIMIVVPIAIMIPFQIYNIIRYSTEELELYKELEAFKALLKASEEYVKEPVSNILQENHDMVKDILQVLSS